VAATDSGAVAAVEDRAGPKPNRPMMVSEAVVCRGWAWNITYDPPKSGGA